MSNLEERERSFGSWRIQAGEREREERESKLRRSWLGYCLSM
jgi:hypothetical protein